MSAAFSGRDVGGGAAGGPTADGSSAGGPDPVVSRIIRRIPAEVIGLAFILALGAAILFDPLTGVFVLAGGAVSAGAFIWLERALTRVLAQGKARALKAGLGLYLLRLALILVIFSLIIVVYPAKLLAFVAGFSAVILVFLGEAAGALARLKTWKD